MSDPASLSPSAAELPAAAPAGAPCRPDPVDPLDSIRHIDPLAAVDPNDMVEIWHAVAGEAKARNLRAAETARKMWRARPHLVWLDLPPIDGTASIDRAHATVIAAASTCRITPRDGRDFSTMLENRRRSLEMLDMEAILREISERRRLKGPDRP
jgi:hypothetical protein